MIREAIQAELARRKWTVYQLAKEVAGKMPEAAVYQFLKGERDVQVKYADLLLDALKLTVKRKRG